MVGFIMLHHINGNAGLYNIEEIECIEFKNPNIWILMKRTTNSIPVKETLKDITIMLTTYKGGICSIVMVE